MKILKASLLDKLFFIRARYSKLKQIQKSDWASDETITEELSGLNVLEDIEEGAVDDSNSKKIIIDYVLNLTNGIDCSVYENEINTILQIILNKAKDYYNMKADKNYEYDNLSKTKHITCSNTYFVVSIVDNVKFASIMYLDQDSKLITNNISYLEYIFGQIFLGPDKQYREPIVPSDLLEYSKKKTIFKKKTFEATQLLLDECALALGSSISANTFDLIKNYMENTKKSYKFKKQLSKIEFTLETRKQTKEEINQQLSSLQEISNALANDNGILKN